jgi:RHS repeat-associated protein
MAASSEIHSNAFNFMSFMEGGVDPRTGLYTMSISLPGLQSNDLRGPELPLLLSYSPLNRFDTGYGVGWNLTLSQFTPGDHMLTLSTGESYKVTGSGSTPDIAEKKLNTFNFEDLGGDTYRVAHINGMVEMLETRGSERIALPSRLYSPAGHSVSLEYESYQGKQCLKSISDAKGELLRISHPSLNLVEILIHPDAGDDAGSSVLYQLNLIGGHVREIVLPTEEKASWRIDYETLRDVLCITEVKTPVGGIETVKYLDAGHGFPGNSGRKNLPRVTQHLTDPGFGQSVIEVNYTYSNNNFLGYGEAISWADDGLDNLYKVPTGYEYWTRSELTVDTRSVRVVTSTYNRFHLLTRQLTDQNGHIKTVDTEYYAEEVPFGEQPAQFQMPKQVKTAWTLGASKREETVLTEFDEYGNPTSETLANGVTTSYLYYPKEGDGGTGCPADPEGFVRNLQETKVTPSASGQAGAPVLATRYRYRALPPVDGGADKNWLAVADEALGEVQGNAFTALQSTTNLYIDSPDSVFNHGRLNQMSVELNGKKTTTDYTYEPSPVRSARLAANVQRTVETLTGFDGEVKTITLEHSLLNGEPLLTRDDNNVEILYTYDALNRVTSETVAPGVVDFEATRYYSYVLVAEGSPQAEQTLTDVKGVSVRTRVDGLNRVIYEEREAKDDETRAVDYRQTYEARHDALGNLVSETVYDWPLTDDAGHPGWRIEDPKAFTTTFEYDDWGALRCQTGPDGIKRYEETDPIGTSEWEGPVKRVWEEHPDTETSTGITETWLNLFEKPTRILRRAAKGDNATTVINQYLYDGLGRSVEEADARGAQTLYRYDVFDRLIETTLPLGAKVTRAFVDHSGEELPVEISVDGVVLGTQTFDGLSRKTASVTGGRKQTFNYLAGQLQPESVVTANGQQIKYEYKPVLSEEPTRRVLPDIASDGTPRVVEASYEYDKKNARLLKCTEKDISLSRDYFTTGELKSEQRTQGADTPFDMQYRYSLEGRLLTFTDVLGQVQTHDYDDAGRLTATVLGTTTAQFTYDGLGRIKTIVTTDSASKQHVGIALDYDEFGRETKRTFDLNGTEQTLSQVYDDKDALVQKTLREGSQVLRDEAYAYDLRGRLIEYTCAGSQPPTDPYGQLICAQTFEYDALDNLTLVKTGSNAATYLYETPGDPTQLTRVTNTDAAYPPQIVLEYDADGNLIADEAGRTLEYDALGRLLSVSSRDGGDPGHYRFDPLDTLASTADGGSTEQRFYQTGDLANTIKDGKGTTFLRGGGVLLGELGDAANTLLVSDQHNSVLGELAGAQTTSVAYSAYGERSTTTTVATSMAFNGEYREVQTGCYLLGNGYRAYSPTLMRFHGPDSLSPFGEGGINAYAYCQGDPVNLMDPTGHFGGFLLRLFKKPPTTGTFSGVKELPLSLKRTSGSTKVLHKITKKDYKNADLASQWADKHVRFGKIKGSGKESVWHTMNGLGQSKEYKGVRVLNDDVEFIKKNIGNIGITSTSRKEIAALAKKQEAYNDLTRLNDLDEIKRRAASKKTLIRQGPAHYLGANED